MHTSVFGGVLLVCVWKGEEHLPGTELGALGLQDKQFYPFRHPTVLEKAFDKNPTFLQNKSSKKTGGDIIKALSNKPRSNIILNRKKSKYSH